ncbi:MAG: U4/U6-U5 snRNP complex subunit prp3 [Alyxoria varia]|nr:MAG: U4/U6-U5 snRNP complex subunit prp3 [Alyxoria varia]
MPEKRQRNDSSTDTQNDPKRSRANDGSPAAPSTTNSGANASTLPPNIQEKIAQAKARAAAVRDRFATGEKPGSTPSTPQQQQPPAQDSARAKIEAMKARVAAATGKPTSTTPQQAAQQQAPHRPTPPKQSGPSFQPPPDHEDSLSKARGGLGIGIHPALLGDMKQDGRGKKTMGPKFGTTMGNRRESPHDDSTQKRKRQLDISGPSLEELKADNPYFDASLANAVPHARKPRELALNPKGKYIAQATAQRRAAHLEEMKRKIAESTRRAELNEDRSEHAFLVKDVPNIEWWDGENMNPAADAYPNFDDDAMAAEQLLKFNTDESVIRYIQHPVRLEPPQEGLAFQQKPMYLTKEEQKKMRRQKRMEDLKERQAKVRLGLEPPEPPKIKKSNLMRVLGEEAVKDPTAVEARVNREIAERHEKHEQDNETRKLTKDQRHEKDAANMERDAAKGLVQAVYRVGSLAYGKHRAKIDMNAKQFADLTGLMLTNPRCCLVIVEAGQKTSAFMKKLMTRRLDWEEIAPPNNPGRVKSDDAGGKDVKKDEPPPKWLEPYDESGNLKDLTGNGCALLWEGDIKARSFKRWAIKDCETDGSARQTLERNHLENVWQLARNWSE